MNNHTVSPGGRQGRRCNDENRPQGVYGDHLKQKKEGMVRILFQNPQGLGWIRGGSSIHSPKIMKLRDTLIKHKIDILGLSETNKDWRAIPQKDSFWAITDGWFEHRRLNTGINRKIPISSQVQYGGTLLMAMNKMAYSITTADEDIRHLGHWTSFLFRGKNQHHCRVICAYCPCKSSGTKSTYALQVVGLAQTRIMECPRKQFWQDLKEYIQQCQNNDEQVIVMGDWNTKYDEVVEWMSQFDLVDSIQLRHSSLTPPPTCNRSSLGPIDAIFVPSHYTCWRGGYLSFDYLEGDHRGIWCDIPVEFILGYNMQHPAHPKARRLKTTDPRIRNKYLKHLHKLLLTKQIYTQMEELMKTATSGLLPSDIIKYEEIDEYITSAMQEAELKCRKLKTGTVKWSPLYQKACDRVTYWTLMRKDALLQKVNRRKILSLRKKLRITHGHPPTIEDIERSLKDAVTNRKKCKQYADDLQMEYRHRLAKAKEEEDNVPAAIHIRNLTQQENTRILFRRIRYLEKKMTNLSTSRVTISSKVGNTRELTRKEDIERCIISSNDKKFHQTEGHGQLQKGQLLRDLGILGTGPKAEQVQSGTYYPPRGTLKATKQFLACLKRPEGFKVIPPITFQEFCTGWKKAKERTSSNGPHFGHYKAAIHHCHVSRLLYKRALIPMITGYAPKRHRQGIDVMLLKKENVNDVDKLRTVVLFDSEANMNYKHLGRRAMKAAIKLHQIVPEQYSRPNRSSIDHALNRQLVMDHQTYTREPYALVSVDLKSCYDRINHTSASLALQRTGIHKAEIISMFDSIQRMTHKVRTAFGDSKRTYGGNSSTSKWKLPPQGVLQGNGSGPAIWSILSSSIFQALHHQGHYNILTSAIRNLILQLTGFAYVDDTDLLQTVQTVEKVVQDMQKTLNAWQDCASVTGGLLSPAKCWWYLVTFKYTRGRWTACNMEENGFHLWIKDECNKRVSLKQIDISSGMNMLGVKLAPNGNRRDHVDMLRNKALQWAMGMKSSKANNDEVWTALHRTIPFALCYSLPAIPLTREECNYIFAPVIKTGLPLAGIVSTIPTALRTGSISNGGLGIIDPYFHMGISHIVTLVTQRWKNSPTGHLIEIALDDIALELGMSSPWQSNHLHKGLQYTTTHTWIHQTLSFSLEHNIRILLKNPSFPPTRDEDKTIMELALTTIAKRTTLQSINRVRMAINVVWLSDITTADGRSINPNWLKHNSNYPHRNDHKWPLKHHTNAEDWTTWRRWIKTLCRDRTLYLIHPLGSWIVKQDDWIANWDCFVTSSGELLYRRNKEGQGWKRHILTPGRRHRHFRYYNDFLPCTGPPESANELYRASIKTHSTYIEVIAIGHPPCRWTPAIIPNNQFWISCGSITKEFLLHKLAESMHTVYLDTSAQLDLLFQDFSNGTMISVSDGSYLPQQNNAACAWIMESSCRSQWIMGSAKIPGQPHTDYSAYRSELAGLLAVSVTIKILSGSLTQPPHLIVGCNGQAALRILSMTRDTMQLANKHADLQSSIVDIWSSLTTSPYPVHIYGHQENTKKDLNRLEEMNILADRLAALTAATDTPPPAYYRLPGIGMDVVRSNNGIIRGDLYRRLYDDLTTNRLMEYYTKRIFMAPEITSTVDFDPFAAARNRMPLSMIKFITKWTGNVIATGKILQRRNHRIFNRCPRCNAWGEDKTHVVVCWDIRAKIIWDRRLTSLHSLLLSINTHPDITQFIINGLDTFRKHPNRPGTQPIREDWKLEQWNIGWLNFLTGFLSTKLVAFQQAHYTRMGCRKSSKHWAAKVIGHGWYTIYKLWLGRNEVLHEKNTINALSGEMLLDIEIEKEYSEGYNHLPTTVHKWFRPPLEHTLAQSVEYKKGWLLIVRTVKEALNIAEYSIFESSRALRKWIGLHSE